jgi:hypothetical protein
LKRLQENCKLLQIPGIQHWTGYWSDADSVVVLQLVTVWSAPNYCYRCGNVAAVLEFDENLNKAFKVFEAAPQGAAIGQGQTKKTVPDYFL